MPLFFYLGKVRYLSHRIRDLVINTKTGVLSESLITVDFLDQVLKQSFYWNWGAQFSSRFYKL